MENIKIELTDKVVCDVPKTLYGIFFEDINHSADGGINAELIQNNSFEYEYINYNDKKEKVCLMYDRLKFWDISGGGSFCVSQKSPISKNNLSYLETHCADRLLICNCGYGALGNDEGISADYGDYEFSAFFRNIDFIGKVYAYLFSNGEKISDKIEIIPISQNFKKLSGIINANKACFCKLVIELVGKGELHIDYVSLRKLDAYGDERWTGGKLNNKIVDALRDLHPSFMRFPGGCIVEGDADLGNRYEWKETIGSLEKRKQKANTWGYLQSYAVGFYEYFLLCEDFSMAPLPVLPCGLLCQIRSMQRGEGDIQYARDDNEFKTSVIDNFAHLIFFARGDINSSDDTERYWANLRADMGHSAPFNMNMLGVGNENWGDIYFSNVEKTLDALKNYDYCGERIDLAEKYSITYILSVGVDIRPQDTNKSWRVILQKYPNCIVDEHVYNCGEWFYDNANRYDSYDRSGAKVFMGEYAMHTNSDGFGGLGGKPTLEAGIAEAAFLTGVERNCDVVSLTAYAPLLAYTKGYAWTPNLIWFNSRDVMKTPSYYVQAMFAEFTGDKLMNAPYISSESGGGVFIGCFNSEIKLKTIVIASDNTIIYKYDFACGLAEWKKFGNVITRSENIIKCDEFGGYYLDRDFGDCSIALECEKISGAEGVILGVNIMLNNGKLSGKMFNYGALGHSAAYEKYRNGFRVAFETLEDINAKTENIKKIELNLHKNSLQGYVNGECILNKSVYNSNNDFFYSVTSNESHTFIKVVNSSEKTRTIKLCGKKLYSKAELTILSGKKDAQNSIHPVSGFKETIFPVKKSVDLIKIKNIIKIKPFSLTVILL